MKTAIQKLRNKPLVREAINCWLRYTLSQPIDIDVSILVVFVLQYFGLRRIGQGLAQQWAAMSLVVMSFSGKWFGNQIAFALRRA